MLRSFRLANHRSFAAEHELLLMPVARGDHRATVPVAAIYGANASGKSTVLHGLAFMREAVLRSFAQWESGEGVPRQPFRLDREHREKPSVFVTEFITGGVRYTYGFSVDDTRVREEWLYSYPEKRKRVIFERNGSSIEFGSTVVDARAKLELLEELIESNVLLLSVCGRLKLDALVPAYDWFRNTLRIREDGSPSATQAVARTVADFVNQRPDNADRLLSLLRSADTGISKILVEDNRSTLEQHLASFLEEYKSPDSTAEKENRVNDRVDHISVDIVAPQVRVFLPKDWPDQWEIKFAHGDEGQLLSLAEESAGTRNWLELLPLALAALDSAQVLVVDEINASLHPLLAAQLIELFQDEATNPHGAQLIFTTHDTSLLGTMVGENVLKREQVWFVEKDARQMSTLYPLSDFKPRADQNTERRYLGGSYGAVPLLDRCDFVHAVRGDDDPA